MTHSNYTRDHLKNFSRGELYQECDRLSIPHRRSKEDYITDILDAQPQLVAQAELLVEQPVNLPVVDDTHFIGGFLLRCAQINGEYAVVWDVLDEKNVVMGEIRMGWDCFWTHTMSLDTFATPQEAVVDLRESLEGFAKEDEAIAFEKVADGRWESIVNGVLVRVTLEFQSEYKCNLVDTVFTDYESAVKGSLVAVAKLQAQPEKAESAVLGFAQEEQLSKTPALEVFATTRPNVYAVYSHKPGLESKRYEVDLTSDSEGVASPREALASQLLRGDDAAQRASSCTCPHYEHRHSLEGFKDKHIEAVRAALLIGTTPLPIEEEMLLNKPFDELTATDWERICKPELELVAA